MKRHLLNIRLRMQSGMKRLEDLREVFPEAKTAIDGVLIADFNEALRDILYLSEVSDE